MGKNPGYRANLRIYDVSDPFVPKEIAYFLPPDPEGPNWFDTEEGDLLPGLQVAITEDISMWILIRMECTS